MFSFFRRNDLKTVKANELSELIGKANIIDIREPYEYRGGHVPTAKNIPMGNIISSPDKYLKKDKEYHIICQSGARSTRVCNALIKNGFNVVNVSGGTGRYTGTLK